jgi:hypothetical protein
MTLSAVNQNKIYIMLLWDVAPLRLVGGYRMLEGTYCFENGGTTLYVLRFFVNGHSPP